MRRQCHVGDFGQRMIRGQRLDVEYVETGVADRSKSSLLFLS
jgi:hypothetical protein